MQSEKFYNLGTKCVNCGARFSVFELWTFFFFLITSLLNVSASVFFPINGVNSDIYLMSYYED